MERTIKFYTDLEIENLPVPEQLIEDILPTGAFGEIFGQPGIGKSFVLLDMLLCIATGKAWCGKKTLPGPVIYVVAEGVSGIPKRLAAWKQYHSVGIIPNILFLAEAIQLMQRDTMTHFGEAILSVIPEPPKLIVIDTLARCIPGAEENSSKDMGTVVRNLDHLRQLTGAAVILCHHAKKGSNEDRGSSAIRGAVDVMLYLKKADDHLQVICDKAKDLPEFKSLTLSLTPYRNSCVIKLAAQQKPDLIFGLSRNEIHVLKTLVIAQAHLQEVTSGQLQELSGFKRNFYDVVKPLTQQGYISTTEEGRIKVYKVTAKGREIVRNMCITSANNSNAPDTQSLRAPSPSRGECSSAENNQDEQPSNETKNEDGNEHSEEQDDDLP